MASRNGRHNAGLNFDSATSVVLGEGYRSLHQDGTGSEVPEKPKSEKCPCCGGSGLPYGLAVSAREMPNGGGRLGPQEPAAVLGEVCCQCFRLHAGELPAWACRTNVEKVIIELGRFLPAGVLVTVVSPCCDRCGDALDLSMGFYRGPRCPSCVRAAASDAAAREGVEAFRAEIRASLDARAAASDAAAREGFEAFRAEIRASLDARLAAGEESAAALVQKLVAAQAAATRPQEKTMTEASKPRHPIIQTLQVDATDAAWRAAGSQLVKLTRDPLAAVLCRHLGPDDPALRARVAAFLQTELGAALLSAVLSAVLGALPLAGPVPERMARELRVRAMAGVGDELADVLMGPLREVAAVYLQGDVPQQPAAPLGLGVPPPPPYAVVDDAAVVESKAR